MDEKLLVVGDYSICLSSYCLSKFDEQIGCCDTVQEVCLMYLCHKHHGEAGLAAFEVLRHYIPVQRHELAPRVFSPDMSDDKMRVTTLRRWSFDNFILFELRVEHFGFGSDSTEWLVCYEGHCADIAPTIDSAIANIAAFPHRGSSGGLGLILSDMTTKKLGGVNE